MGLETAAIIAAAAAAIPALYGVGKDVFGPGQSDIDAAGADKIANMQKAGGAVGAYRPDQADARMKAMQQQLGAFKGAGNMMNAMYGGAGGAGGNGGIGGTYTPGSGGYLPPGYQHGTPGWTAPTGNTNTGPGRLDLTPKDNDGSIKGTPSGSTDGRGGPPILAPGVGGGAGGTMPGSSGTSLVGPDYQSMASLLAKQGRY